GSRGGQSGPCADVVPVGAAARRGHRLHGAGRAHQRGGGRHRRLSPPPRRGPRGRGGGAARAARLGRSARGM
ncbi:MAG: hypothetical protein AVDCRST_MAG04-3109, partial [uncultured Acetobacteraceae bacterium]